MMTSDVLTALLASLAETTDDTQTLRVLAAADLPRENAFYHAHLESADRLPTTLRGQNWQILDQFAESGDDASASMIVAALREAAGHDEHEVALGAPLRKASNAATELLLSRNARPVPTPPIVTPPSVTEGAGTRTVPLTKTGDQSVPVPDTLPAVEVPAPSPMPSAVQVPAGKVAELVEKICEAADENPDAVFEISWRIVTD
jgi:hypothetical protein